MLAKSSRARRWIRTLGNSEVVDEDLMLANENLVPPDENLVPADENLVPANEDLVPPPVFLDMRFPCSGFTMKMREEIC